VKPVAPAGEKFVPVAGSVVWTEWDEFVLVSVCAGTKTYSCDAWGEWKVYPTFVIDGDEDGWDAGWVWSPGEG
jgi:hypothetical protein